MKVNSIIEIEFNLNKDLYIIKSNLDEKLENIFQKYCKEKGLSINSLVFLKNGVVINNLEQTLEEISNNYEKSNKKLTILVKRINSELNINKVDNKAKTQRDIITNKKNKYFNKNKSVNIIEEETVQKFDVDINTKENTLNIINENDEVTINFKYQDLYNPIKCSREDKLEKACIEFANEKRKVKKYLKFYFYSEVIEQDKTIKHFFNENYINEDRKEITLYVEDNEPCFNKNLLFLLSIIPIIGAIIGILVSNYKSDSSSKKSSNVNGDNIKNETKCDNGYTLTKYDQCIIDYFIKAIYFSNSNEKVKLISDNYNINKINKLIIDGEEITPIKSYIFKSQGNHSIYISFNSYNYSSISNIDQANGIFSGIDNLIEVEFSGYIGNYPDVRFYSMFNNCKNLKKVDMSKIRYDYYYYYGYYESDDKFSSEYFNIMDYMFNNCINLTAVYFRSFFPIHRAKYMFNNCISLKNIDLSYTRISCSLQLDLSNMFSNCISLISISLPNINCEKTNNNISYIFYNCSSLSSLNFPSDFMNPPLDMSYSFAYCTSLKEFDLCFKSYKGVENNSIKGAFKNCTSLTSIKLRFDRAFTDMSYLFYGCTSLIKIQANSFTNGVKYMNYMLYDCHSLKSWNNDFSKVSTSLIDISYMFSGCSSLTSVDLSLYNTNNIKNYEGLFYNCQTLISADISSFNHNNLSNSKLSIFDDNYSSNITIIINNDFLNKIKFPANSKIEIK